MIANFRSKRTKQRDKIEFLLYPASQAYIDGTQAELGQHTDILENIKVRLDIQHLPYPLNRSRRITYLIIAIMVIGLLLVADVLLFLLQFIVEEIDIGSLWILMINGVLTVFAVDAIKIVRKATITPETYLDDAYLRLLHLGTLKEGSLHSSSINLLGFTVITYTVAGDDTKYRYTTKNPIQFPDAEELSLTILYLDDQLNVPL